MTHPPAIPEVCPPGEGRHYALCRPRKLLTWNALAHTNCVGIEDCEESVAKRAFISFQMEDASKRNHLVNEAKDERNDLEFIDYSVKKPWDNSWKTECKKRIAMTSGTIVIVGETTYQSEAVEWEIQESDRQGHPVFGIWGRPGLRPALPLGLSHSRIIEWKIDKIIEQIDNW